jgi:galactose oxidase
LGLRPIRQSILPASSVAALVLWAVPAGAQVTDVVVGVTPTCPYGISACWGGAYEGLGHLDGVASVARTPDEYNCTAHVHLKDDGLPDPDKWAEQFRSMMGRVYVFRGVEATIEGSVEEWDGALVLRAPGLKQQVTLAPLRNKLQWNFKKAAPRQPEPDERDAYDQLAGRKKEAKPGALRVQVTGPLKKTDKGLILEVREFYLLTPEESPRYQG